MSDFNFYDDAPPMPAHDPAPPSARQNTEIRAQNGNIGAVIVAVPRNIAVVRKRIAEAANYNGHNWEYRLPFKTKNSDGESVPVTGATIKCANDVFRAFGNCNLDIDPDVRETPEAWYFNAVITDLETGSRLARPFRQRKNPNTGGRMDADRQLDMAFQIGVSKAERNVVVNFLAGLMDEALDMARKSVIKKIEANPQKWIANIRDWLAQSNVPEDRIAKYYNRSLDNLMAAQIAEVVQSIMAVKEGRANKTEFYADGDMNGSVVDMPKDDGAKPDAKAAPKSEEKTEPKGGKGKAADDKPKDEAKADDTPPPAEAEKNQPKDEEKPKGDGSSLFDE